MADEANRLFCALGGRRGDDSEGTVRAPGPAAAVSQLVETVTKAVPAAVPLRVDEDLVSMSDIAQRLGPTGEPVRLLVDGKRGPGRLTWPDEASYPAFSSSGGAGE